MRRDSSGILLSELAHVIASLQRLVGRTPGSFFSSTPWSLVMEVGRDLVLMEVWPTPRLHTIKRRPPAPKRPLSFQGLLRARCEGPILAFTHHDGDRAFTLRFATGSLVVRLYGRGGGMWWMEESGAVAASDGPCEPELDPPPPMLPDATAPRFAPLEGEAWDEAAGRWFGAVVAANELADLRAHVLQRVDRRRAQLRRLVKNLEGDLEAALGAPELRADADCLAAELGRIRRGTSRLEVPDIHRGEGTRTLSLDPARSPAETLSRMYAKAGRLERAQDEIITRIQVAETEEAHLGAARQTAAAATTDQLRRLIRELKLPEPQPPKPVAKTARAPWTTWTDGDHHTVLVGRDAPGNHRLVFRQARGRDLWIHLRDRPSAHVVIPVDRKGPPPEHVVAFGVELALRSARIPEGQSEDLRVARVADLRAVPDGAPGEVSVTRERVVRASPQPRAFPQWIRQDA